MAQSINKHIDLDPLEQFLMSDHAPPNCMEISDLDGFLTGIAVGPELILPSEWLPVVWGGDGPVFESAEEANAILSIILGRYNEILQTLQNDPEGLAPIFWETPDGVIIATDWGEGFLDAVRLRIDAWEPLMRHKRDGVLLMPILALCGDEEGNSLLPIDPADENAMLDAAPEIIPGCVAAIYQFWRERQHPSTTRPKTSKTGRNEPCSCGSGKKFKRCCGAV